MRIQALMQDSGETESLEVTEQMATVRQDLVWSCDESFQGLAMGPLLPEVMPTDEVEQEWVLL